MRCNVAAGRSSRYPTRLLESLPQPPNLLIRQRAHPQAALRDPLNRLERVQRARLEQPQQRLDDARCSPTPLKIHQRRRSRGARNLARLLRVEQQVVRVDAHKWDAPHFCGPARGLATGAAALHLGAHVVKVSGRGHERLEVAQRAGVAGGDHGPGLG